jgi:type VI secretion system protein ImpA
MAHTIHDIPVDVERLLDPISPDQPAGTSLRYEGTYDAVKDARHADNPSLPQGIYERELDTADWEAVERLCTDALETKTKDLQLAAWLTEAWIHRYGVGGAAAGIDLMAGLVEGFWADVYPPIKDGDLGFRLAPIRWVNDKLSPTLKSVPLTAPDVSGDADTFTLADWERAAPEAEAADDPPTRSDVRTSVTLTPTAYYQDLVAGLDELLDASQALERLLADRCDPDVAGLDRWKDTLREMRSFGQRVLTEREPAEEPEPEADDDEKMPDWMPSAAGESEPVEVGNVTIQSRADAYQLLWEAAEFLLRTEPHSPTPYLVKRAVSWGSMSLDELLHELVKSGDDLDEIYELLGMDDARPRDDPA